MFSSFDAWIILTYALLLGVIKIYIVIVPFIKSAMESLLVDRKLNWFKLFSVAQLLIFVHLFLSCNGNSALHDTYIFFAAK